MEKIGFLASTAEEIAGLSSTRRSELEVDPPPPVAGKHVQFRPGGDRRDLFADRRRALARHADEDFAGLLVMAVDEGFRADALDRFDLQIERQAAVRLAAVLNVRSSGRTPTMPASAGSAETPPMPGDCFSDSRFIGGAPMKEATNVVSGRR